jgi:hypothetical protein
MTKQFTADQFRQNPAPVYRAADKGNRVEITHSHYKDRTYVLVAEDKKGNDDGE